MTRFATRVLGTIRRYGLVGAGDRVAVAVSGGADSVALAFVLWELARRHGFTVAGLVHLHHGLRGRDADADEEFCHTLANRLGVAFDTERIEAATLARAGGVSLEHAGHDARYSFFARAAKRLAASVVATGHTMDDQAETVLLRLVRGGRHDPLSGIHPRAGLVVRPLLDVRRGDVERFLSERRLPWREDRTNADKVFLRNRIRHELLPLLRDHFAPGIVRTLAVGADVSRQDQEHLNRLATEAAPAVILAGHEGPARTVGLDRVGLAALPPALTRRILRWALLDLGGRATSAHVAQLCHLLLSPPGGGLALGRVLVDVSPSEVRLSRPPAAGELEKARWPWFGAGARAVRFALPIPGSVELPGAGGVVTVEAVPSALASASHRTDDALVDGALAGASLFVRFRRPGDRLRPLGLSGHKKLQDLLVDRKVPRDERDRVPLVVSADDRIVWVAGQALAADFAVSPAATGVLLLKFRRSGGKG